MNNVTVQLYCKLFENRPHEFSVYYLVYDDDGEIVSKMSFDENNPSLGRVNTLSVPPSLIRSQDLQKTDQ